MSLGQLKLSQAAALMSPNPVTVVCTEKPGGLRDFGKEEQLQ